MAFIERDPDEMLKFAQAAKKYASSMVFLLRTTEGTADSYKDDLNNESQECIEKLHENCHKFIEQVDVYYELATQIEKKARQQKDIKPRF